MIDNNFLHSFWLTTKKWSLTITAGYILPCHLLYTVLRSFSYFHSAQWITWEIIWLSGRSGKYRREKWDSFCFASSDTIPPIINCSYILFLFNIRDTEYLFYLRITINILLYYYYYLNTIIPSWGIMLLSLKYIYIYRVVQLNRD